jgi:polyisoprenoid-binding protein YceI
VNNQYPLRKSYVLKKSFATAILISVVTVIAISLSSYADSNYAVTDDYSINFSTTRAEGSFSQLKGYVNFSEDLSSSEMNVSVEVNTIKTGNKTKDKHARGSKWLNAEEYPRISFVSKKLTTIETGYQVTGDLTIKGTTIETNINFTSQDIDGINYLIGNTMINREAFQIMGNRFAFLVGDDINIDIKVPSNYNN